VAAGLTPIVCIGETLAEREENRTFDVLRTQVEGSLRGVAAEQLSRLVVAYEPVWAIGTGRTATPAQAGEAHAFVRERLREGWGAEAADPCHIIYGGSVKPDNIGELIAQPHVDGALVGGASLDVQAFFDIVSRSGGGTV
jgi:triosephosphate isomerase